MSCSNRACKTALKHIIELKFEDFSGNLSQLPKYSSLGTINIIQGPHEKAHAKLSDSIILVFEKSPVYNCLMLLVLSELTVFIREHQNSADSLICHACIVLIINNEEYFCSCDNLPERPSIFNSTMCFSAALLALL